MDGPARDAERAADRLARLHALVLELAEATALDEVATIVVRHARAALGARHVLLAIAEEGDSSLTIMRATGVTADALEDCRVVARGARMPIAEAARTGEPVFLPSCEGALARFPDMASMIAATKARSCAAVPLVAEGSVLGALTFCFVAPRSFGADDRAFLALFARECAASLHRATALESERRARERAESAARASEFLARASGALTQSLDTAPTLSRIARIAVPYLADACAIDLPGEHGRIVRVAAAHVDPDREKLLRDLVREHPIDPRGMHPIAHVMRTGEAELVGAVDDGARAAFSAGRQIDRAQAFPVASYMIVPLVARARILGTMMLASERPDRRYKRVDLVLAEELAARAALALDNARLYEEARRAVRVRDDLLAIVSHDLRNPLGVVQATVQLMERQAPRDESFARFRHHCEGIRRASDRMARLITDLLDFAGLQSGRLSIMLGAHDAGAIIDEAATAMRPMAAQNGITLVVDAASGVQVRCDRARVLQVLGNLVGNAIKFTPDGGSITIAVATSTTPDGRVVACFSVKDTGSGIAPQHLPHVFDRYWQAKETARLGTGLGLTIAKGLVEAHGGTIGVESKPGEGACFFFTLPAGDDG